MPTLLVILLTFIAALCFTLALSELAATAMSKAASAYRQQAAPFAIFPPELQN